MRVSRFHEEQIVRLLREQELSGQPLAAREPATRSSSLPLLPLSLGSGELSREPGVGKRQGWVLEDRVARVVEQRTEDQLPGRAALELLALTRCCLAVKRDKPSGAVAAVPSCSECESHSLSHGARTWVIR